jgi:uncharacterized protein (DUF433 family)
MVYRVQLAEDTYTLLRRRSREMGRDPDELADEVLRTHLSPVHPYIETIVTRSGSKAMIKGTRIAVSTIIGYARLGESPESIVQSVLPHLTLAQIHDALSYYYDHQDEIEAELTYNTEVASQTRLREQMGEAAFLRLTGQVVQS